MGKELKIQDNRETRKTDRNDIESTVRKDKKKTAENQSIQTVKEETRKGCIRCKKVGDKQEVIFFKQFEDNF